MSINEYLRQQRDFAIMGTGFDTPSCVGCGVVFKTLEYDTTDIGQGREWFRKYSVEGYIVCKKCAKENKEICKNCNSRLAEIVPFMVSTYNFEFKLDEDYEDEHPGWSDKLDDCDVVCDECGRLEGPSHDPKLKDPNQKVLYFYDCEKDVSTDEKVLYSHDNGKKKKKKTGSKAARAVKTPAADDVAVKKNETEKKSVGLDKELSKSQLKDAKKIMKLLRKPSTKTEKKEAKETKQAKEEKEKTKPKPKVTGKRNAESQDDVSGGDGDDANWGTFVKDADGLFVKKLKVKAA